MIRENKTKNSSVIMYRIMIIFFVFALAFALFAEFNKASNVNCYSNFTSNLKENTLNDYITYNINGNKSRNIAMKDVKFIPIEKDDTMTIDVNMDKNYDDQNMIMLMCEYCTVDAYVDGSLIYSYGHNLAQTGECLSGGYFKIPINNNYIGKDLKIVLSATEDYNISGLESISIEAKDNIVNSFVMKNIHIIVIAIFLLIFGVLLCVLSFFRSVIASDGRQISWISLCYILISLWFFSHFKILQIRTNNLQFINSLEYISLYFGSIPFVLFFREFISKKVCKVIYYVYLAVISLFCIGSVMLNVCGVMHYVSLLPIYHAIALVGCILIIIYLFGNWSDIKNQKNISFIYSVLIVLIVLALEVARYYLYGYFKNNILSYSLVPLGVCLFVISMMYTYIVGVLQKVYHNNEQNGLLDLAFKDQLTQVPNRTKCEEYMRTLSGKINESYTVINLDLNNLKYVNDTFGHHIGDEMIFSGAQIIQKIFGLYGQVGRMGGDEFIAIITITDKIEIEKLLAEMNEKIKKFNDNKDKNRKFVLSIAYGYAIKLKNSTESIWKVYEEADKMMYECKKKQKKK